MNTVTVIEREVCEFQIIEYCVADRAAALDDTVTTPFDDEMLMPFVKVPGDQLEGRRPEMIGDTESEVPAIA